MTEEERQNLIEQRKKEQAERELQYDLNRDLKIQDEINEISGIQEKDQNKFTVLAIIFLGTLIPLYVFLFGFKFIFMVLFGPVLALIEVDISWVNTYLHILIWTLSVISVYRERSVMDDILEVFF
ncbi:hypothetical protein G3570_03645 [Balneolaceae bacterium YR4-1]|uniref:Uncharacterized protein n=1 Tax=Halalkalibaculum roseum TaxID=2709311 RepID=A0A6M1SSA0_9BACT|nr:hypothetical protein [Halalkalibaculum roseum]NGP75710.1 hypothetical protein [Halalkalibaculum roseum]